MPFQPSLRGRNLFVEKGGYEQQFWDCLSNTNSNSNSWKTPLAISIAIAIVGKSPQQQQYQQQQCQKRQQQQQFQYYCSCLMQSIRWRTLWVTFSLGIFLLFSSQIRGFEIEMKFVVNNHLIEIRNNGQKSQDFFHLYFVDFQRLLIFQLGSSIYYLSQRRKSSICLYSQHLDVATTRIVVKNKLSKEVTDLQQQQQEKIRTKRSFK